MNPSGRAHTLYTHAVETILGFLDLTNLINAYKVCHHWKGATLSMHGINASFPLKGMKPLASTNSTSCMILSPLAVRHITELHAGRVVFPKSSLPQLTSLKCLVRIPDDLSQMYFPLRLRKLSLYLSGSFTGASKSAALKEICLQCSRLEALKLRGWNEIEFFHDSSLASLQSLPHLKHLLIQNSEKANVLTSSQLSELRKLHNLQSMRLDGRNLQKSSIKNVLVRPHSLQWKYLGKIEAALDEDIADAITQLPSQTKLDIVIDTVSTWHLQCLEMLPSLSILTLRRDAYGQTNFMRSHIVSSTLVRLSSLHTLSVNSSTRIANDHSFWSNLPPSLTSLCAESHESYLICAVAENARLVSTLQHLEWHGAPECVHPDTIKSLCLFSALRYLVLPDSILSTDGNVMLRERPCKLLPHLDTYREHECRYAYMSQSCL